MEVLIYLIAGGVMFILFLGVTISPAIAAYLIGRRFSSSPLRWLPLAVVVAVPLAWWYASYSSFKDACKAVQPPIFFERPQAKAGGFLNESGARLNFLVEAGEFQFVERPEGTDRIRRDFGGQRARSDAPVPLKTEWGRGSASKSDYVVVRGDQRIKAWWRPPIYNYGLEVREKITGRVVAKTTDLVFGGGVAGIYLSVVNGGDQDFEHVSCGYASATIDAWRPSLVSRPRYKQYQEADLKFLVEALTPASK